MSLIFPSLLNRWPIRAVRFKMVVELLFIVYKLKKVREKWTIYPWNMKQQNTQTIYTNVRLHYGFMASCLIRHYYIHPTSYRRGGYILACVQCATWYILFKRMIYRRFYDARMFDFFKKKICCSRVTVESHKSDGCMHVCQLNLYHYFLQRKETEENKKKKKNPEVKLESLI
jgi:hypothetical protein